MPETRLWMECVETIAQCVILLFISMSTSESYYGRSCMHLISLPVVKTPCLPHTTSSSSKLTNRLQ
jgi:hypothetical protein